MSSRDDGVGVAPVDQTAARLTAAREAGGWLPWAAAASAVIWWGAACGGLFAMGDLAAFWEREPLMATAAVLGALLPGLLLLMAGFMARESRRSAEANAIVLEAAAGLLNPARAAQGEVQRLTHSLTEAAGQIEASMASALEGLAGLAKAVGDERLRLESVTYAVADNSRDLAERLGEERHALEALGRDLRSQTEAMSEAIPRQAAAMIEAAKAASAEVAQSDTALDARLKTLAQTTDALRTRLEELDGISTEIVAKSDALDTVADRVSEKLDGAKRTIDTASRASDMAATAAANAGDRLRDAVSDSLDGARRATESIVEAARRASKEAADALEALQTASKQSAAAVKAAGNAARMEAELAERRIASLKAMEAAAKPGRAIERPAPAGPTPTPAPPPAPAPASHVHMDASPPAPPRYTPPANGGSNGLEDDELFDAEQSLRPPPAIVAPLDERLHRDASDRDPPPTPRRAQTAVAALSGAANPSPKAAPWRDILADMDPREVMDQGLPRESTADELINRLSSSGIRLPDAFRPRDKRKIAAAARKGELERRVTTRTLAAKEVERVSARLDNDAKLKTLAESFLAQEGDDALRALEQTQNSSRNASPRLSAFLLLDAALGPDSQPN